MYKKGKIIKIINNTWLKISDATLIVALIFQTDIM